MLKDTKCLATLEQSEEQFFYAKMALGKKTIARGSSTEVIFNVNIIRTNLTQNHSHKTLYHIVIL